MFEGACFRMMKKPLLYWNLSGNVLTGTGTIFLILAWKIKLNLLQTTLVQLHLSETFFFNEKATSPELLDAHLSGFSVGIQCARAIISSSKKHPKIPEEQEGKKISWYTSHDFHEYSQISTTEFQTQFSLKFKVLSRYLTCFSYGTQQYQLQNFWCHGCFHYKFPILQALQLKYLESHKLATYSISYQLKRNTYFSFQKNLI